jgi:hypothetical protein
MKSFYGLSILGICAAITFFILNSKESNNQFDNEQVPLVRPLDVNNESEKPLLLNEGEISSIDSTRQSASNSEQLIFVKRPNVKIDEKLSSVIETLKLSADSGNNEAAYILAINLRTCNATPSNDIGLEEKLQQESEYNDNGAAIRKTSERYEFCAGVDANQRIQFYNYLETAAKNGYVPAQEFMATITPKQFLELNGYSGLAREELITKRGEFIEQKIIFLESASKQGSIRALTRLSKMNYSQNAGKDARIDAYSNNKIILELTDSNYLYGRYSRYQQNLESQLTPEETEQALIVSNEWLKIIKINGTLYTE